MGVVSTTFNSILREGDTMVKNRNTLDNAVDIRN